jgi:mannose-6-phosphate isomerase-like protein (cupin superfamily)
MVESWAKQIDRSARFVKPDITDGEAIIFDGRLWHGTENRRQEGKRTAVLLQYAAADEQISIPDESQLEWPFRFRSERPPTLIISGTAPPGLYDVEKAPSLSYSPPVPHVLHEWQALESDPATGWKPHFIFQGSTCNLEHLTVHSSVLSPGCSPHLPHVHPEEEILLVLDGEAVCVIPNSAEQNDPRTEVLRRGEFIYYPAYQYHTIRNASARPITYLMMKWRGPLEFSTSQWSVPSLRPEKVIPTEGESFAPRFLAEFPTSYLAKLHSHQSVLLPGGGYDPHVDDHDVAIIVLDGILETQGRTFGPNAFLLHSAGAAHGVRNVGKEPARYLVFEFHAPTLARNDRMRGISLLEQLTTAQAQSDALAREKTVFETSLLEQLRRAQAQSNALAREKTALETDLAAVRASRSWRITAPLRSTSRLLGQIKSKRSAKI